MTRSDSSPLAQLSESLFRFQDTCSVYCICTGDLAVLIDFGAGDILDHLEAAGVRQVTDVLVTHYHRDQVQGLARASAHGARIWVPQAEQDLFAGIEEHWQSRQVDNNYNVLQDRFSLLEPVEPGGLLHDYSTIHLNGFDLTVLPAPGHTPGSVSLLAEIDSRRVAFTGDLIAAHGKTWSASALQWSYAGFEGAAASIPSLHDLQDRLPDLLLPSHGDPIENPQPAIQALVENLWRLLQEHKKNPNLFGWLESPYLPVTAHLLRNQTSLANSYVLLSNSGSALLIDFGYDFMTGQPADTSRASRRPWLHSLPALKQKYGVQHIEVVIPTHYHDDHVAGFNLLRDAEGTQVWAAQEMVPILENPTRYNLPCLWFDPIPVDRALPLGQPFAWQEYTLTLHDLPGHTRGAVAIEFEVDGLRMLATGDQYQGVKVDRCNPIYQNGFHLPDYRTSAALLARIQPDMVLPGHWNPLPVTPGYLERLKERGEALEQIHQDLLPPDRSGDEPVVLIHPYRQSIQPGEPARLVVDVRNPLPFPQAMTLKLVVPSGWWSAGDDVHIELGGGGETRVEFTAIAPANLDARRVRLAVDVTIGDSHLGQQAEALVTVRKNGREPPKIS